MDRAGNGEPSEDDVGIADMLTDYMSSLEQNDLLSCSFQADLIYTNNVTFNFRKIVVFILLGFKGLDVIYQY